MIITFLATFVPILGAIVAGVVAVLVTLVTAGATQALVIAAVAIVVQQLDNDLLAPVIYGRALRLHPLAVLLAIVAGGALFGLVGTFLAVPVLAVVANVMDELRRDGTALDPSRRPASDRRRERRSRLGSGAGCVEAVEHVPRRLGDAVVAVLDSTLLGVDERRPEDQAEVAVREAESVLRLLRRTGVDGEVPLAVAVVAVTFDLGVAVGRRRLALPHSVVRSY